MVLGLLLILLGTLLLGVGLGLGFQYGWKRLDIDIKWQAPSGPPPEATP